MFSIFVTLENKHNLRRSIDKFAEKQRRRTVRIQTDANLMQPETLRRTPINQMNQILRKIILAVITSFISFHAASQNQNSYQWVWGITPPAQTVSAPSGPAVCRFLKTFASAPVVGQWNGSACVSVVPSQQSSGPYAQFLVLRSGSGGWLTPPYILPMMPGENTGKYITLSSIGDALSGGNGYVDNTEGSGRSPLWICSMGGQIGVLKSTGIYYECIIPRPGSLQTDQVIVLNGVMVTPDVQQENVYAWVRSATPPPDAVLSGSGKNLYVCRGTVDLPGIPGYSILGTGYDNRCFGNAFSLGTQPVVKVTSSIQWLVPVAAKLNWIRGQADKFATTVVGVVPAGVVKTNNANYVLCSWRGVTGIVDFPNSPTRNRCLAPAVDPFTGLPTKPYTPGIEPPYMLMGRILN